MALVAPALALCLLLARCGGEGGWFGGALDVTATGPNGGETWVVGMPATVSWSTEGAVGELRIELSTDGGGTWTTLVGSTANDGAETVTVPDTTSTQCRIRLSETDGDPSDTSDADFAITDVDPDLVVWFRFDDSAGSGTALDSSTRGNDGTAAGVTFLPSTGRIGGAASFAGNTGSYVITNPASEFPSTEITTAFWVRTTDSHDGLVSYAVGAGASLDNEWLLIASNSITIYRRSPGAGSGVPVKDGRWHHVAVTWRRLDGQLQLYVDGASRYSATRAAGSAIVADGALVVAQEQDSKGGGFEPSQSFEGLMDDLRIYNRVLSPAEVEAVCRMGLTVWHVDADASPGGDGKSWATAFTTVQEAMTAASAGHEVWVAEGAYTNNGGGTATVLTMKEGVEVYGGFAGTETRRDDRGPAMNAVVLDGENTAYHVVEGASYATLDGFTVTRGNANAAEPGDRGGGMLNHALTGLAVRNCAFTTNQAVLGGGMRNQSGTSVRIVNCVFASNTAEQGGAVKNVSAGTVDIINCTFHGNAATVQGAAVDNSDCSPTVTNCILWGDTAPTGPEVINDVTASCTVTYSDIQGGYVGAGNIDADPLFVDAADPDGPDDIWGTSDDGLRLRAGSPCIDAADGDAVDGDAAPATDILGSPRHDDPGMPDAGVAAANGEHPDMGAYEFQGTTRLASASVAGATVTVQDADGHVLWTFDAASNILVAIVADIDGDGVDEVVVGTDATAKGTVYAIDSDGEEMWQFQMGVGSSGSPYAPDDNHLIRAIQAGDVDGDGVPEVVALSTHSPFYPGRLAVLDGPTGAMQGEYWNPGYVYCVEIAEIDPTNTCREIIVGCTNNDRVGGLNVPGIFALAGDNVSGEAPPDYGDFPAGSELWYAFVDLGANAGIRALRVTPNWIVGNTQADWDGTDYYVDYNGNVIAPTFAFEEDWESGTIDAGRWKQFGTPASFLQTSGRGGSSCSLDTNGDASRSSGVVSWQEFPFDSGTTYSCWIKMDGRGGTFYDNIKFSIASASPSDFSDTNYPALCEIVWYNETSHAGEEVVARYWDGSQMVAVATEPDSAWLSFGVWHLVEIVAKVDTFEFHIDGRILAETGTDVDVSRGQGAVVLKGNSVGEPQYVDDISVWQP